MKTTLIFCAFLIALPSVAAWENPAVLCPEEILPKGYECPDLSDVKNPYNDLPSSMSQGEKNDWINFRASDLKVCRNREILRREENYPGSYTPLQIQLAWMIVDGGKNVSEKLQGILRASREHQIPPHVLIGALTQESLLSSLGISPDGGNYSCGIAQLNIQEWCTSANWLSVEEKEKLGWPQSVSCESLPSTIVKPFYDIAVTRLGDRPSYKMTASDFRGITASQVVGSFPAGSESLQSTRFQAITSFLNNCQNITLSIPFKARVLKNLFHNFVPQALKTAQVYPSGQSYGRRCDSPYPSRYYPLHTGWLLAVAAYNAGPRQVQLVEHYFKIKDNKFPSLSPVDLIEALHWGGKVKETNNRVYFTGQRGMLLNQLWYKSCVVQRHVARVIQHVTIPGQTIARSLEQTPCATGTVPKYRRISSGVKEN